MTVRVTDRRRAERTLPHGAATGSQKLETALLGAGGGILGRFVYDGNNRVEIEDRTLAHLQMTIGAKLRRGEAFFFTWKDDVSVGKGRTTVWMHAGASLVFTFHGSRSPAINRAWLEALMYTANSPSGLYVVPEPAETAADKLIVE